MKEHTAEKKTKTFEVYRYDPEAGGEGHFDRFELEVEDEHTTTILDVLLRIQKEQDPSLAFRYACRVSMCGSCAMVINGREGLACKTVLAGLRGDRITIRPLNHFPIIKDLVVDMNPFFEQLEEAIPYFHAAQAAAEPAVIRPDSKERLDIGFSTECIACGACVSSCSMAHWHKDYLGPAALNRAFTLLADSRDGLREERLAKVLEGCYNCRLEFNCTEVCPTEISPTRAIKYIHRLAAKEAFRRRAAGTEAEGRRALPPEHPRLPSPEMTRRRFMAKATLGLGAATTVFLGGLLTATALVPSLKDRLRKWVPVGPVRDFQPGSVTTVQIGYRVEDGFYRHRVVKPVMVSRRNAGEEITVFDSRCTHLGCTVHWDREKELFLCACHGGTFYPDGTVKAGPPPRPLDRFATKIEAGQLLVLEA
jgi:succinate dehydrogenase / fumarate reductase iron-sulfur subunit